LLLVAKDLEGAKGPKLVILLSDGKESCGGDPNAAIQTLKKQGLDVRVNIVGFAIEGQTLKQSFARWAEFGGAMHFDASTDDQLAGAMRDALRPKFQVLDGTDTVIADGTAGGEAVSVPAGKYRVRVLTNPPAEFNDIQVGGEADRTSGSSNIKTLGALSCPLRVLAV
jgi:hypothetical protein